MNKLISTALCFDLPAGDAPDWVHLLPAGENGQIKSFDARGPYEAKDLQAIVDASMASPRGMVIDVNHSTDLAAPLGGEAPARGWIKELQARDDGIWGRVEWTDEGRQMVASRSYRMLSPVIGLAAKGSKRIVSILRASLVNRPNLQGLAALNFEQEEEPMGFLQTMAELLGQPDDATEADITAAAEKAFAKPAEPAAETELQSQLGEIAKALGVADGGDILAAAKSAAAPAEIAALQAEITTMATQLNQLQADGKRGNAEAFVDAEIAKGRVGLKPLRERYVELCMSDPAAGKELVEGLPILTPGANPRIVTPPKEGEIQLNAEQEAAAKAMGMSTEAFAKALADEQKEVL
ncbi:phage protease [Pseudoroseicyclus sp. H15]